MKTKNTNTKELPWVRRYTKGLGTNHVLEVAGLTFHVYMARNNVSWTAAHGSWGEDYTTLLEAKAACETLLREIHAELTAALR